MEDIIMTLNKKYIVALDMTGPFSSWCIADKNKNIIEEKSLKISRKSNSVFFDSMMQKLKELKITFKDINEWYVGVGPGSYTGIRVGAAFVSGIIFCSEDVNVIGVPSFYPMAAEVGIGKNENIGILFQVTNKKLLVYDIKNSNDVYLTETEPVLFDENNVVEIFEKYSKLVTIQELENNQLYQQYLAGKVEVLSKFPVHRMFDKECNTDSRNIDELIYTRPAVTTVAK